MHEWGKWGRPFHEYGIDAALAALDDAGIDWADVQFVAGGETVRNGYPGYVAASTITQALGWNGARVASCYARLRLRRHRPRRGPRRASSPACATSPSWSAPTRRRRASSPRSPASGGTTPTGCASACSAPPTRPTSRSTPAAAMDLYGATDADFAKVKVKNAKHGLHNPYARYRKEVTEEEVLASPMVADPLRLLEICATSDGAAAVVLTSMDYAAQARGASSPVRIRGRLHGHAAVPEHRHRDAELRHRLRRRARAARAHVPRLDRRTPPTRRPASAPRT